MARLQAAKAPAARTKSLLTGTKVKNLGSGTFLLTTNYYDLEGRIIQSKSSNHLNGTDVVDNTWNFDGSLKASTRTHTVGSTVTTIANRYEYDHAGRKIATFENINNQGDIALNHLEYNEIGQLTKKNLHNDAQAITFAYNERGWMKNSTFDQFSMELKYNDGSLPQFNGNISGQNYTNGTANAFTYSYDKLNRLTNATAGNDLGETISYDVMGNITSLTRDNFGTNNYIGYNGNLTSDSQKNITLGYNFLNLPQTVSGSQNLTYTYNATGEKLQKQVGGTTTNYIHGIQYTNNNIDFIQTEEGIARNNNGSYSYEYNLSDHLGNIRATFYKNPVTNQLEILQQDNYYAFGLRKEPVVKAGTNKYLYNGKELQEELGQYDYGARFYDPVIGRWNVIDAKSELYFQITPYAYAANTPTNAIDPNGHLVIFINGQHGGDGGSAEYWTSKSKRFDSAVQKHFNDWSKPRYYDGAVGGWKNTFYIADMSAKNMQYDNMSANSRWSAGYNQAKKDAEAIILSLARTGGVITESLKIVSHSMGGAYAKGFVKAIIQYAQDHPELTKGLRISEYDFDPFQGGELKAEHGVHTEQYMHNGKKHISWWKFWDTDKIADQKQSGLEMDDNKFVESPTQTQHSIFSFFNNISQLEEGKYVFKNGEWQKSN